MTVPTPPSGTEGTGVTPPPEQPPPNPPAPTPPPETPPADPSAPDVTKLQTALEKERSLRRDAERRAKEGDAHRARAEELESASQSDNEKAVATARKEGAAEARKTANSTLVRAEARALAAEAKFRDPARVVRLLDGLDDVAVADDGTVDSAAIRKQLDELGKEAQYLLAGEEKPPGPKPDPTQGARDTKTSGTDVGREMFDARRKKPAS